MGNLTRQIRKPRKAVAKQGLKKGGKSASGEVVKNSLSGAALRMLVAASPTPAAFDRAETQPPFDLQDK